MLRNSLEIARAAFRPINQSAVGNYSLATVIVTSLAVGYLVQKAYHAYQDWDTKKVKDGFIDKSIKYGMMLPWIGPQIKAKIDIELADTFASLKHEIDETRKNWNPIAKLPDKPTSPQEIIQRFAQLDEHYHRGKISGAVYTEYDPALRELLEKIWGKTTLTNPLHSHWPLLHMMKAEVISWCQHLLNGTSSGHGIITHGGTTSIMEACFAYVRYMREKGIEIPEIIVPETAHVAFDKAAEILKAKIIKIPVDTKTGKVDVQTMRKAITTRTGMLVGSAPSYPLGIIDNIAEIAELAKKNGIPCHVDACLGGPQTALAQAAGFENIPPCDFSIPGVTSISFDTHKYLEAPKGTSVLVFSPECKATPTQAYLDSVCGMYVTDTFDGSDNGARIATLWALLLARGKDYYVNNIHKILKLQRELVTELKKIEGIEIAFEPQLSVIGIRTKEGSNINPLIIAQQFESRGWSVNIVRGPGKKAEAFHFCLTSVHTNSDDENFHFVRDFVADMQASVLYAKAVPDEKPKGNAKAYGKIEEGIPDFLLKRIGEAYVRFQNTIPGVTIPGFWQQPATSKVSTLMVSESERPPDLRPSAAIKY